MVAGNTTPLVAGHAFSVEPGIYLAGRFGARIEDIVVATDDGPLSLQRGRPRPYGRGGLTGPLGPGDRPAASRLVGRRLLTRNSSRRASSRTRRKHWISVSRDESRSWRRPPRVSGVPRPRRLRTRASGSSSPAGAKRPWPARKRRSGRSGAEVVAVRADVTEPADARPPRLGRLGALRPPRHRRAQRRRAAAGGLARGRRRGHLEGGPGEPAHERPVRAGGAAPYARRRGGAASAASPRHTIVQASPTLALSNTARTGLWAWAKTAAAGSARHGRDPQSRLSRASRHGPHARARRPADRPMGDPADFGKVVAFLCSQPAGYLNGARLVVDGGDTLAL